MTDRAAQGYARHARRQGAARAPHGVTPHRTGAHLDIFCGSSSPAARIKRAVSRARPSHQPSHHDRASPFLPPGPRGRARALRGSLGAQQTPPTRPEGARRARAVVPMDSARAAELYVSNRPEDHPPADYAEQMAAKKRTDSIYAARSEGVMEFRKVDVQEPRRRDGDPRVPVRAAQDARRDAGTRRWCGCTAACTATGTRTTCRSCKEAVAARLRGHHAGLPRQHRLRRGAPQRDRLRRQGGGRRDVGASTS